MNHTFEQVQVFSYEIKHSPMPCNHRFQHLLIPKQRDLQFLIIGTFNPSWNAENGDNAEYFYGRKSNQFWCILPHAFYSPCLIDKGAEEWVAFCERHHIGLTDIIGSISNANEDDGDHFSDLTISFEDRKLEKQVIGHYFYTPQFRHGEIMATIEANKSSLKGVYFTRSTFNDIPRIRQRWIAIQAFCEPLGIPALALPTPSPRGNTAIRDKIRQWRDAVQGALHPEKVLEEIVAE